MKQAEMPCWFCNGNRRDCPICKGNGVVIEQRLEEGEEPPITLQETFKEEADYA